MKLFKTISDKCKSIWVAIKPHTPVPYKKERAWTGVCPCCKGTICDDKEPSEETKKTMQCLGCACGWTPEGKARIAAKEKAAADRHQIELYKTAIREMEDEKNGKT